MGSDVLRGGGGNDKLIGAKNGDTLTGNGGKDQFVFKSKDSLFKDYDSITDLQIGKDKIISNKTDEDVTNISKLAKTFNKKQIKSVFKKVNLEANTAYTFETKDTKDTFLF